MLYLVVDCFALKMWHTGSIDVLSHPDISRIIGRFFRMLLSTVCRIFVNGCPVMFWNCLEISDLFTSWMVYCLLFSFTCVIGQR